MMLQSTTQLQKSGGTKSVRSKAALRFLPWHLSMSQQHDIPAQESVMGVFASVTSPRRRYATFVSSSGSFVEFLTIRLYTPSV